MLDKYKVQVYNLLEKYVSSLTFLEELKKIKDKKKKLLFDN